jgi:hypothetical protein
MVSGNGSHNCQISDSQFVSSAVRIISEKCIQISDTFVKTLQRFGVKLCLPLSKDGHLEGDEKEILLKV